LTDGLTWSSPLVQFGIHGLPCDAKLTGPEAESNPKPKIFPPAYFIVATRVSQSNFNQTSCVVPFLCHSESRCM